MVHRTGCNCEKCCPDVERDAQSIPEELQRIMIMPSRYDESIIQRAKDILVASGLFVVEDVHGLRRAIEEIADSAQTFFDRNLFAATEDYINLRKSASPNRPGGCSSLDVQVGGGHYKSLKIQPVEYCQKNQLNFCESSAIKYITRHKEKNGKEDIKKAIHFLQMLLEMEYGEVQVEKEDSFKSESWDKVFDLCCELGMDADEPGSGIKLVLQFIKDLDRRSTQAPKWSEYEKLSMKVGAGQATAEEKKRYKEIVEKLNPVPVVDAVEEIFRGEG